MATTGGRSQRPFKCPNIPRISGCERDHVPEAAVGRSGRARGTPVPVRGGAAGAADPAATAAAASGRRAGRGQPTAPTAAAATAAATTTAAARTAGTMMIQRDTASNSVTQQDYARESKVEGRCGSNPVGSVCPMPPDGCTNGIQVPTQSQPYIP